MKNRMTRIINAMILPVLLSSCMADEPDTGMTSPDTVGDAATRTVESRPVFRDIRGIDPTLPGQYVKLDFPVVLDGDTTLITGNFSVMPYHCWEENGEDKAGDYYVVEADFTAHNGTLSRSFMKELDVQVKLRDKEGGEVPEGRFYDFPTPGTTIANKEYVNSSTTTVAGTGYAGSVAPYVGHEYVTDHSYANGIFRTVLPLYNGTFFPHDFANEVTFNIIDGDQVIPYTVNISGTLMTLPNDDGRYVFFTGPDVPKELTDRVFYLHQSNLPEGGPANKVNLYRDYDGSRTTDEHTKVVVQQKFFTANSESQDPALRNFDKFKLRHLGDRYGDDFYRLVFHINKNDRKGLKNFTVGNDFMYMNKPILALGVEGHVGMGFGWSKSQRYYDLDKSTLLNTSGNDLRYTYKVSNADDKDRGIPAVATGDLHGHSAWAWRIPVRESSLTAEELADSLFRVEVTVGGVYGDRDDVKAAKRPCAGSVLTRSFALDAPMRAKTGSVTFTNRSGNPVRGLKLLSVPYEEWAASDYDDSYVLSRSDGSLCTGQSRTMTVTADECWLVCEPVDRRTFKPTGYRHTDRIDVRLDPLEPATTNVSTVDLDN